MRDEDQIILNDHDCIKPGPKKLWLKKKYKERVLPWTAGMAELGNCMQKWG